MTNPTPIAETLTREEAPAAWQARLRGCFVSALRPAWETGLWLLAVTVPVSFVVLVLKVTGALGVLARLFDPVFSLFGLPGESALVFVTACLVDTYSCIAVIDMLGLTGRTVTILALMCLISHSLLVESAIQKKTGSGFLPILLTRVCASFVGALVLSILIPVDGPSVSASATSEALVVAGFAAELKAWCVGISLLCLKIMVLITLLMVLERILNEYEGVEEITADAPTRSLRSKPELVFHPRDEREFLKGLVKNGAAWVHVYKDDGTVETSTWHASRMTLESNLRANIWSGRLRDWSQKGIVKAEFFLDPKDLKVDVFRSSGPGGQSVTPRIRLSALRIFLPVWS